MFTLSSLAKLRLNCNLASRFVLINNHKFCSTIKPETKNRIEKLIKEKKIILFMKGDKDAPKCGFSNVVTQILKMHVSDFEGVNVLEDDEIRSAIKEYSQWPTIPQVYINGEFVGGCDIMLQMHQSGDLISLLEKSGIQSKLNKPEESENKDLEDKKD